MTNPTILIHNVETGKILEREMNAKELAELNVQKAKAKAESEAEAEKAAEKAALLQRLGINEDEAKLLLS